MAAWDAADEKPREWRGGVGSWVRLLGGFVQVAMAVRSCDYEPPRQAHPVKAEVDKLVGSWQLGSCPWWAATDRG